MNRDEILLSVRGLCVSFFAEDGLVQVVHDVSFSIRKGRTFALVGESGCGKTTAALSIMRLVPAPQGKIISGEIVFEGQDLLQLREKQMRQVRGNKVAMIFQEPMTSLNPVYKVGDQIVEAIRLHRDINGRQAWTAAVEMLRKVGIADPEQRARQYPHQMSGGMQQRVMIAMAASCQPQFLIADEPTTALDVTTQAQILDLLDQLQKQNGMSILLITHDLGIVAERANDAAVMYASRIVEMAPKGQLFAAPFHPYTRGLLQSMPQLGLSAKRLQTIPGTVPDPLHFPSGCKFHPRCPIGQVNRRCQTVEPMLKKFEIRNSKFEIAPRWVACWYAAKS